MSDSIELLKQNPLFAPLSEIVLGKIAQVVTEKSYPPEAYLFYEGDLGKTAYVIKSGSVEVLKGDDNADQTVLGISGPGELIGDMAILEEEVRSASVKALEHTVALEIPGDDFTNLIQENGEIGFQFIKMLSYRLREAGQDRLHKMVDLLAIEREMDLARKIQADFLPEKLPHIPNWEIAASFQPARAVGGDFYDAFTLTDNRIAFVIADVCGKGVGAALFMANIRSLIHAFAEQSHFLWPDQLSNGNTQLPSHLATSFFTASAAGSNALNAIALTNDYIVRNHGQASMFATLFFGVLELTSGQLTYVNGGHNPPVVFNQNGIKAQLNPTGPMVGVTVDLEFEIAQTQLDPGDVLIGFTDGIPDARNTSGEFFGDHRLLQLIIQGQTKSAADWLAHIDTTVQRHIGEASQFDDMTMIALRHLPIY
ncbi:MAG: SpoIIE family protein phosphatase [Chloroflexota bacterium]